VIVVLNTRVNLGIRIGMYILSRSIACGLNALPSFSSSHIDVRLYLVLTVPAQTICRLYVVTMFTAAPLATVPRENHAPVVEHAGVEDEVSGGVPWARSYFAVSLTTSKRTPVY
jgi:hypothetical protein